MPSLYLKKDYSGPPSGGIYHSRQGSVERGVASLSKDPMSGNTSTARSPGIRHNNFIETISVRGTQPPPRIGTASVSSQKSPKPTVASVNPSKNMLTSTLGDLGISLATERMTSIDQSVVAPPKLNLAQTLNFQSSLSNTQRSRYARPTGKNEPVRPKDAVYESIVSTHREAAIMASTGRQNLNNSVDKLRPALGSLGHTRTLSQQLPVADEKKDYQGSTRCNDVETTILWREDIALDVEQELSFVSCLGQGSFAKVYEGYDKRLKQRVAIKVIDKRKILEPKRRALIQTEVSILARMKQKNIVEFYRLVEDHKRVFMVMALCGAMTVNVFCRQFQDKRLNDEQAYAIFSQIAKGVLYMHDHNVAHRDLKLTNILIDDHYTVKIIDFGFACEGNEMHRMYCGTPSYMSPEIVEKKLYAPKPTDVWAMGVILYKLLSGDYAFGAEDHPELKKNIINVRYELPVYFSSRVKSFLECCFEYDPNKRITVQQMFEHPWMLKHKNLL